MVYVKNKVENWRKDQLYGDQLISELAKEINDKLVNKTDYFGVCLKVTEWATLRQEASFGKQRYPF